MKRLPEKTPPKAPKTTREGVVLHEHAQEFFDWVAVVMEVLRERAFLTEQNARAAIAGAKSRAYDSGGGGRVYAEDGTLPGPTPILAMQGEDDTAMLMKLYASSFSQIRHSVLNLVWVADRLLVMSQEEARRLKHEEEGGADCGGCQRFVAQTPNDRLRSGLCHSCYAEKRRKTGVDA